MASPPWRTRAKTWSPSTGRFSARARTRERAVVPISGYTNQRLLPGPDLPVLSLRECSYDSDNKKVPGRLRGEDAICCDKVADQSPLPVRISHFAYASPSAWLPVPRKPTPRVARAVEELAVPAAARPSNYPFIDEPANTPSRKMATVAKHKTIGPPLMSANQKFRNTVAQSSITPIVATMPRTTPPFISPSSDLDITPYHCLANQKTNTEPQWNQPCDHYRPTLLWLMLSRGSRGETQHTKGNRAQTQAKWRPHGCGEFNQRGLSFENIIQLPIELTQDNSPCNAHLSRRTMTPKNVVLGLVARRAITARVEMTTRLRNPAPSIDTPTRAPPVPRWILVNSQPRAPHGNCRGRPFAEADWAFLAQESMLSVNLKALKA